MIPMNRAMVDFPQLAKQEPAHLTQRVDRHAEEVLRWNGEPLVKGMTPGRDAVQLVSNDYLSLANHPEIVEAQIQQLRLNGRGVMMSDVFRSGEDALHGFEAAIAAHTGTEDAVICQSGWNANVGLLQCIADEKTPVYIDMFAHMSLWEGAQVAGATVKPFRHNDMTSLERLVQRHGPGVIAVDSVYSTSGHICPLEDLVSIAQAYDCVVVADESHSLGVFGERGEGLTAMLGLSDLVHFQTASLSKAFSARGGIISGSSRNIKYYRYASNPAIFSSAVLPHEAAAFMATLEVVQRENQRRIKLQRNADYLRAHLCQLGYPVADSECQIIALVAGAEERTRALRDALEQRGVFGSVFCTPATPKNRSLVRLSVNCTLSTDELNRVLQVCHAIRDEVRPQEWPLAKHQKLETESARQYA